MRFKLKTLTALTSVILAGSSIVVAQDKPIFVFTQKQDSARQDTIDKTANAVKSKVMAKESARISADNKKTSAQLLVNEVKPYASFGLLHSEDQAASNSGSEASKYKGGGSFDINPRTGGFNFSVPFKTFASLDFSVSKTTNTSLTGKSYFNLPAGLIFKGLPFIIVNKGERILSYQGNNYYIDSQYASADSKGQPFHSGLRYQSTETFIYKESEGSLSVGGEKIKFSSYLEYANGNHLYFNQAGLMIAMTDAFFVSGQDQNHKHISRVYYENMNASAEDNRILRVVDATDQELHFDYGIMQLKVSYPKNVNGKTPEMIIFPDRVLTRFSADQWVGMEFSSDFNNLITSTSDVVTDNGYKVIQTNKIYQANYGVRNGMPVTLSLRVENPETVDENITTHFSYLGDSNNGFKYGHDTTIDQGLQSPDFYNKIKYATTVSVGNISTKHYYTYLHAEIKTTSFALVNGKKQMLSKATNTFSPVLNKDGVGLLKATYQMPNSSESVVYEGGVPVAKNKSEATYNAYGMKTSEKAYKAVAYDQEFGAPITTKTTTYDPRHMIAVNSVTTDNVTGRKVTETIKLGPNGLLPIEKDTAVEMGGQKEELPKQLTTYQTDTSGLGGYHVAGLPETKTITDGTNTVTTKYEYYYDQPQNKLRTVEINDAGVKAESVSVDGSVVSETSGLGLTTNFKYYDNGQPLSKTDYLGHTEKTQTILIPDAKYNSQTISKSTDAFGNETVIGSDWMGNQVFSSIPTTGKTGYAEGVDTYTFAEDFPQKVKSTDKFGNYQLFFYDDLHRVNKIETYSVDGKLMTTGNISQTNVCDSQYGCFVKVVKDNGAGSLTTQYVRGKQVLFEETVINGNTIKKISYDYGDSGQLNSTTTYDPNNPSNILTSSSYVYGPLGHKTEVNTYISGMHFSERYHFDKWTDKPTYSQYFANGQLVHTSYIQSYNEYGSVQKRGYKDGDHFVWTTATFDKYQRPVKMIDFNGNVETDTYDNHGNLSTKLFAYPDGKKDLSSGLHFTYDNYGRQLTLKNTADTVTLLYTPKGAQLGEEHTANGGYKSTISLNAKNDLDTYTDALGNSYKYVYDKSGRETILKSNLGTITYKYDDSNPNPLKRSKMIEEDTHFTNAQFKNNLTHSTPGGAHVEGDLKKVWTYNDYGQQESLTTTDDKGNSLKVDYTYDNRQDIIKKVVTDISPKDKLVTNYSYSYDDQDRLLSSSEKVTRSTDTSDPQVEKRLYQYTYDNNSNILHELDRVESSDGVHQTTSDFTYSDTIDDQLVKMVKVVDGKTTTSTMKYDANGNMISITDSPAKPKG